MLIDRKTEKVMAIGFCLEQLTSELIRHYDNYLSNSDEIDLIDLIEVIKELKEEMRKIERNNSSL